ncbi:MAG: hypothetical protein IJH65_11115 [Methanobrevibacter sp.]|nr:hypothetical protein [Methanobrevibacter sp.]
MPWSKKEITRPLYHVAPDRLFVEDRKTYPKDNGNTVVAFIKVDSEELCESVLDPRVVNITTLLQSGCKIEPGDFFNSLSITDKSDLDKLQESQNFILADYLEKHQDYIKDMLFPKTDNES